MSLFALFILQAVSIGLMLYLFFGLYREYRTDRLRHRLFRIRDEFFDRVSAGEIDFNNSAYGITRIMMNGMIRFAHEMSFFRILTIYLISKLHGPASDAGYGDALNRAMKRLTKDQREMVTGIHQQAFSIVLIHMAHVSFVFGPMLLLLKLVREILRPILAMLSLFSLVANTAGKVAEWLILQSITLAPEVRIDLEARAYEIGKDSTAQYV